MLNKGRTLAGALIGISIITLLAVIIITQLLHSTMTANEAAARIGLKAISTALERYATENKQGYPADISILINSNPPYLNRDYVVDSPIQGYNYFCQSLEAGSYGFMAEPQRCGQSGLKIYTITTGGVLSESDCRKEAGK